MVSLQCSLVISLITTITFGGYPLSDPFSNTIGGKTMPYNLIDTDPSCFYEGICPMFPPGGELSSFPNSEEKFQHLLHNLHRMFSNQSLQTPLGAWKNGGNTNGGPSSFCYSCTYCGTTARKPLYWYSDANQAARFKQWDYNSCNRDWYDEPGITFHHTCKWGTTQAQTRGKGGMYTTPTDRCAAFFNNNCGFGWRASTFCHDTKDRCWFETEGICGGNSCLWDAHCEPIFAGKYDYVGKGFVEGMNGVAAVYSRFQKEIYYPLPAATHFDDRVRVISTDRDSNGKHFWLMLQYHDYNKTQTPIACYALYDGMITEMSVYVSYSPFDSGHYNPQVGFYSPSAYNVMFYAKFTPPTYPACQPYAFICKTSRNVFFRLPEENTYYFGTEWIDWKWSNYGSYGYDCKENHYYYHQTEGWTVNGGPTLNKNDIWYYNDGYDCLGCSYISVLDCLATCIYNDNVNNNCMNSCQNNGNTPTINPIQTTTATPTKIPTLQPSDNPTLNPIQNPTISPSKTPTMYPSVTPSMKPSISPTINPSKTPTINPTVKPSNSPSKTPSLSPSEIPTVKPSITPTLNPIETPTTSPSKTPTMYPSVTLTINPSKTPTINPTIIPSISPSKTPTLYPSKNPTSIPSITPTSDPSKTPSATPSTFPTVSPIQTSTSPTNIPTLQPSTPPTLYPSLNPTTIPSDFQTSDPTVSPSLNPSQTPTLYPSKSPSKVPTKFPTKIPTDIPTLNPSKNPTTNPSTTPSDSPSKYPTTSPTPRPTDPGTIICPSSKTGAYNGGVLQFEVEIPFDGNLIFDANHSNFNIIELKAYENNHGNIGNEIAEDSDNNNIITLTNIQSNAYIFTIQGSSNGIFDIEITCSSDNPTQYPTKYPTNNPSNQPSIIPTNIPTSTPTHIPSKTPTNIPTHIPTISPSNNPTNNPTKSPTNNPAVSPTKTPTIHPTKIPSFNPTKLPTLNPSKTPSLYPSQNPSIPPTLYPSHSPTLKPSTTPTVTPTNIPTEIPSISPTESDITCNSIIDWSYQWGRVRKWNEDTMGDTYKSVAEEKFIQAYPQCGEFNTDTLEYYYYFQKRGKKLTISMHICCGDGKTFGCCYNLPNEYDSQYQSNEAIINYKATHNGHYIFNSTQNTYKQSKTFGIKQYIVFGVLGLVIICCGCAIIGLIKYCWNNKHQKILSSKVNKSQMELANVIQMHDLHFPLPGPQHIQLPSVTNTNQTSDGSTITSTGFTSFMTHTDSADLPPMEQPPIKLMGNNAMRVKSLSFSPEMVSAKPNDNITDNIDI